MKTTKKVVILGKLPTKLEAPFHDKDWEIWSMNKHSDADKIPRVDLWFDIHAHNPNPEAGITHDNFPFNEVIELVGGKYFNNSVSYMIAYAILKGYEEIALYGMRFRDDNEKRTMQKQNVRELCFFAKGRGIKVSAPADKELFEGYPLYGI